MNRARFVSALLAAVLIAACSKEPGRSSGSGSGGATPPSARSTITSLIAIPADKTGAVYKLNFRFDRAATRDKPFTANFIEELPGGMGDGLRASLQLASCVAALERGDDLGGVEVFVEVPGKLDGPSMGAVLTLAIMSALDGKAIPTDVGITGSIMPDGGIGYVADLVEKLNAAKTAGLKRVVMPACIRFDKDLKTGQEVDLKQRAGELGLEFIPVDTIGQAYAAIHRQKYEVPSPASVTLSPEVEAFLKKQYEETQKAGEANWNAIAQAQRDMIAKDAYLRANLIDTVARARTAWRAGRFVYASELMRKWSAMTQAYKETDEYFKSLKGEVLSQDALAAYQTIVKAFEQLPVEMALLRDLQKSPTTAAQFCAELPEGRGHRTNYLQLHNRISGAYTELLSTTDAAKSIELGKTVLPGQSAQLFSMKSNAALAQSAAGSVKAWSAQTPAMPLQNDPARVSRLMFNTYYVHQKYFFSLVVKPNAAAMKVDDSAAIAAIGRIDPVVAPWSEVNLRCQVLWTALQEQSNSDNFVHASAAHVFATNVAAVNNVIERWSSFDPITNANPMGFRRTELISNLMGNARTTALASIAACKTRGVPAQQAIFYFEAAETGRDDPVEDKASVLGNYWKASMQAKLLLMFYAPGKI